MGKAKEKVVLRTEPIVYPIPLGGDDDPHLVEEVRQYGTPLFVAEFEGATVAEACQAFVDANREVEAHGGPTLRLAE